MVPPRPDRTMRMCILCNAFHGFDEVSWVFFRYDMYFLYILLKASRITPVCAKPTLSRGHV